MKLLILNLRDERTRSSALALAVFRTMTQDNRVLGVLKFGASDHMEQFVQGLLYMNTLEYFVKLETSSLRRDSYEGTSHMLRGDGAILSCRPVSQVDGPYTPIGEIVGPIRYQPDIIQNVNVFCMHALRESASDTLVDPRNLGFGDTFAIVIEFDEFIKRVKAAAPSTGQDLEYGLIEYIDETSYIGTMGIFKKVSAFFYQSECRIALLPGKGTALPFNIGNLSDIVMLGRLSDLNHRLKARVNAHGRRELLIRN